MEMGLGESMAKKTYGIFFSNSPDGMKYLEMNDAERYTELH